eukprot:CAMPEP_0114595564 /NCGR_PEP_ID=MMETSP0125-20121206/17393_1 /TAXON_ID=485358 ORGANISM="Aristerostoma sp., Strain ATCC 50986" /NCGR_SAMPLE_ID=MMETSP0125 /ASSEMBLY_ACC=CAM_ASM_000245 /LENGTH=206 /DNA_ID=CAMNT_0001797339 /DNA_START=994 /DNA_END=1615 /DNA_ORIENTATION=+
MGIGSFGRGTSSKKERKEESQFQDEVIDAENPLGSRPEDKDKMISNLKKAELPIEVNIDSYHDIRKQMEYLKDADKVNERIALKMTELNSFKNYSADKMYSFIDKTNMYLCFGNRGIFDQSDAKIKYYRPSLLGETVYQKKLHPIIPFIFAWAKSYENLIDLTLYLVTSNKRRDPNFSLMLELLICYSWFMEAMKISFEGLGKAKM